MKKQHEVINNKHINTINKEIYCMIIARSVLLSLLLILHIIELSSNLNLIISWESVALHTTPSMFGKFGFGWMLGGSVDFLHWIFVVERGLLLE